MSYYPVFLNLRERPALVVGGGDVARWKIEGLLPTGARVTVVAPRVVEPIHRLVAEGVVALVARAYAAEDVRGFHLVVAATDDPDVDRSVSADVERAGVLVDVVDRAEISSFIAGPCSRTGIYRSPCRLPEPPPPSPRSYETGCVQTSVPSTASPCRFSGACVSVCEATHAPSPTGAGFSAISQRPGCRPGANEARAGSTRCSLHWRQTA